MRELPQPCSRDENEGGRANPGYQVQRQEDCQLHQLNQTPGLIHSGGGGLSEHFDSVRGVREEDAMWRDEASETLFDKSGLVAIE